MYLGGLELGVNVKRAEISCRSISCFVAKSWHRGRSRSFPAFVQLDRLLWLNHKYRDIRPRKIFIGA